MTDIRSVVTAERSEFADVLAGLTADQWDQPTLCAGWRVRELVAHLTMPFRTSTPQFIAGMVRAGGKFDRYADRQAHRDAAELSSAELLDCLRRNVSHPWKPPGGGYAGALSHDVIHGLDVTVALGIDRRVPLERLQLVFDAVKPRQLKYFGVDLNGVQLQATDLDWSYGTGTPLQRPAQELLLHLCGRTTGVTR
ncbi:maleylpyruvate isomerase family mycothiol-dependent enzyme [Kribbella sp. NPDC004875]|uniref:maleylpyruvate isomerase family mycothiol-dependent enzyme n=1 Tax=Kribbella sp. NPDC004875 TaxID=3364107 RepID=UPI0036824B59